MEGFYANLLKKNISLGSNVKTNSLSVFSAGGTLQENMLEEYELTIKDEADANNCISAEYKNITLETLSSINPTNDCIGTIEVNEKITKDRTEEMDVKILKDKKEEIDLAKKRYLQRKKLKG